MDTRIYVASLSDYNAGILHGAWIDVTDKDSVMEEINKMLAESPTAKEEGLPAEEWAIHDYEGFHPLKLSEYEDIGTLCELAEAIEEHGEPFLIWAASDSSNRDPEAFQDAYVGEYNSLGDYAKGYWENTHGEMKADNWWHPANYIDWQRMGENLEKSGDIWTHEQGGKVYVFNN